MALASLLLLIALILAAVASAGINAGRVNLFALAFAFFVGAMLVETGVLG